MMTSPQHRIESLPAAVFGGASVEKAPPALRLESRSRSPRCLMFYPWNLDEPSGALSLFLSYSKALKNAGYRVDCYAPRAVEGGHGIFDNVFVAPDRESPLTTHLEFIGTSCEDPSLPDKIGRDEASMVAAGVLAAISDYDVIGIQYTRCHSVKKMLRPGLPVVMFTHDLDSLVGRQEEAIFGTPSEYRIEDEAARLKEFDLVTVVGPDDRTALASVAPGMPIVEAPFTLPVEETFNVNEYSAGSLLWISSAAPFHRFSFFWFWTKVWPKIRAARPLCRLIVAGRMSEVAKQFGAAEDPQVSLAGIVRNVDDLYRQCDVLVAPYYFGLGIKTKVIEAMSKGIPVATTTLGVHNTHIEPGRDAVVADEASEYAREVIRLIDSPEMRSQLSRNGRDYIRQWHAPETALASFVEAFDNVRLSRKAASKSRAGALRDLCEPLRHLVPWAIQRCQDDGVRRIAIFGAGSHTRLLIPIWKSLGGPPIKIIVVSGQPAETTCMGLRVVSADDFDANQVDGILLSSHGYERQMAAICRERWSEIRAYTIWRPVQQPDLVPAENFEGICEDKIPTILYEYESTATLPL